MDNIEIVLAEDHAMVRKGFNLILENEPSIEIIDEVQDGKAAIKSVQKHKPDVVVMDISMPRLNGLEATRQILKDYPDTKILILTIHTSDKYIARILQCGAAGYVLKKSAPEELIEAVKTVIKGEKYFSSSISSKIIDKLMNGSLPSDDSANSASLTNREVEILQLISEDYTNKEIAKNLHISIKTVESHRSNIMKKLDLHSPVELTKYAIREGIIHIEDGVD